MRNEAIVLPRLLRSLEEFRKRGGKCYALDTGSIDDSVKICKDWGVTVVEVGEKYLHTINKDLAEKINERFVVDDEEPIVKEGYKYFDFASARNEAASLASNNWVSFIDADEVFTSLNVDELNKIIENEPDVDNFLYDFVFSHREDGAPAIAFNQSKMYNKTKMRWVNSVHEVLQRI